MTNRITTNYLQNEQQQQQTQQISSKATTAITATMAMIALRPTLPAFFPMLETLCTTVGSTVDVCVTVFTTAPSPRASGVALVATKHKTSSNTAADVKRFGVIAIIERKSSLLCQQLTGVKLTRSAL